MKLFSNNIVEHESTEGCKIYPIVVDIKKGIKSGETISFVTSDNKVGIISVELIDNNSPYVIEGNLVTATIHRPDDSVLEMICENIEGNVVTIELGVNGTFIDGVHTFDIKIHRGDDKIVGIPTMSYVVHKSLSSDGCVEEEDKLPIISNLTNEVLRLNGEWDAFTDKFGDIDWEEMQSTGANSVTVNGTRYTQVDGNIALPSYPTLSSLGAEPKNSNIQAHISSTHAPSNAQKNSDITKAEIETKLIGNITTHTHNQYLTQHQDLSHLALKTELHTHSNKAVLDGITSSKVTEWNNKSTFSGNYNDLINKPTIPTKVSQLTNDSGYLTSIPSEYVTESELATKGYLTEHQDISHLANKTELHSHTNKSVLDGITSAKVTEWNNKSVFSGNYNDLTNKPIIPSIEGLTTEDFVKNEIAKIDTSIDIVDSKVSELEDRVEELEKRPIGGGNTTTSTLPSYWKDRIDEISPKIEKLQKEYGVDAFQFLWASDIHSVPGTAPNDTTYIGEIGRYMMDKHKIPFFAISGDIMSQGSHSTVDRVWAEYDKLNAMLSPIRNDEFLATKGNHDGAWGSSVNGVYYLNNIGTKELFNAFYRRQTLDRNRVFGKDGTYFYVDCPNVRFYMLNTHTDGDGSENSNGSAVYNPMKHFVFGNEQLNWIADSLLTIQEGQKVIFMGHAPTRYCLDGSIFENMIASYKNRNSYKGTVNITGQYWGTDEKYSKVSVNKDFSNAKGDLVGYFHGHIHKDTMSIDGYYPVISITTGGGDLRDDYLVNGTLTRVKGTPTETAIDLVTVTSDYIYCTRIGSGYDRKYNRLTKEITIDYNSAYVPPTEEPSEPPVEEESSNLFDINGDGYVTWDGSKMYTNWIPYTTAEAGSKLSTVYHIKGGTPYKFQFRYPSGAETSLIYCTNANSLANVTSDYSDEVKLFQHDFTDGYGIGYMIRFEIRTDCAENLIIQADKPIVDDGLTQCEITSEVTWKENTRLSSSSGDYSTQTGIYASSDIKVKNGDVIRIYGASDWLTYGYVCAYSDSGFLSHIDMYSGTESSTNYFKAVRDSEQILTITILHSSVTYIRVCNKSLNPSTVRVFRNMELDINNLVIPNATNTTDTSIWVNGYRFSSSGLSAQEGTSVSNKIQIKKGDTIKISGVTLRESQDRLCVNFSRGDNGEVADAVGYFNVGVVIGGIKLMSYKGYANGVYTFFVESEYTGTINYFRFAMPTPTNFSKVKVIREGIEPDITYTNQLLLSVASDGTPFNGGKGWKTGYRISLSGGGESALEGAECTGFIPVPNQLAVIRMKNIGTYVTDGGEEGHYGIVGYDKDFNKLSANGMHLTTMTSEVSEDGVVTLQKLEWATHFANAELAYVRISSRRIDESSIITINEHIV